MTGAPGRSAELYRVGVVGCGLMGSGIAELCARVGLDVLVAVRSPASVPVRRQELRTSLDRLVGKQRMTEAERDDALARIRFTTDLTDLADRQLVIEAIKEDKAAKCDLFATLDEIVEDEEAVLASNTSSLPIMGLAAATGRPEHVLGMHFFSPAQVIPLVELVPSLYTHEGVVARAEKFLADVLGKEVIRSTDRSGFLVNALLVPYLVSAIRMLENGHGSAEVIDKAMVRGCSHPVGPLKLADLIGLDVIASVSDALFKEFKEPLYAPPPLLMRMVDGGRLGKKTGQGFYVYG
jgi:3-hydroxybutyryl-CoA dehydrogenase